MRNRTLAITLAVLLAGILATRLMDKESAPLEATISASEKSASHTDTPQPDSAQIAEPAQASTPVPPSNFVSNDRGAPREFELSMTEAVERTEQGKDRIVRLDPPATPATLATRLREIESARPVLPVCYEVGKPRTAAYRRIITPDITVEYESPDSQLQLPAGLTLRERPSYAPQFAVVSATDPFAALDRIDGVRTSAGVVEADIQLAALRQKKALPNDPLISDQWHIKASGSAVAGSDINVENAWLYGASGGVRGNGIRIGIVDDGLQTAHPDLAANVDTANDKDWNGNDNDPNPESGDDHGTACAGNAAAVGNNSLGVTGSAPEATLVGMRLIAAAVSDSQEAEAMSYLPDLIEIKSNSWGPNDDGETLEAPGSLTRAALANAAATGRSGLGSIFVWAGGNGGDVGDNSNYDGYANDIHTIAVAASNSSAQQSFYSEPGANLVVIAPSSGQLGITTTDRTGSNGYSSSDYTDDFGGTSSSTPTVAGVIALMLEKNSSLNWRDVQEILIASAHKIDPTDSDWSDNAAGFHFNHKYGAGLVDATAAVSLADGWTSLSSASSDSVSESGLSVSIPDDNAAGITRSLTLNGTNLRCEQVTVQVSINHTYRGDLEISLTSPSGSVSRLAEERGDSNNNYSEWTFSTVRHWGENTNGIWTLRIADRADGDVGSLTAVTLTAHGATGTPTNPGPLVQINSPTDGSSFSPGASVDVNITATDLNADGSPGTVVSVELFDNGSSLGTDISSPYSFNLSPGLGGHSLTAVAIDGEGESSSSGSVNFTVVNQAPVITAADLTPSPQAFSDESIAVTGLTASDPEGSTPSFSYAWESSDDGVTWTATGLTGDTLAANAALEGLLWRCRITADDGFTTSAPFVTSTSNSLQRPAASANAGAAFSYPSGLVLRGSESTLSRDAIINEFSQGSSGSAEWIEILVLRETSLRNWQLTDSNGTPLIFANLPAWDAIGAGTLIVIYNGSDRDNLLPPDDSDSADGTLIVASDDSAFFTGSWPGYGNGGDFAVLRNANDDAVAGFSYGSNNSVTPQLGTVNGGKSVYYEGNSDAGADSAAAWTITSSTVARSPRGSRVATTLPISFGGSWSPLPTGFSGDTSTYGSDLGGDTDPGSAKFDSSGESLTIEFSSSAGTLSYWLKGNTGGSSDATGNFIVEESSDGISYSPLRTLQAIPAASDDYSDTPASTTRFIRFRYETKTIGNVQLDALEITSGGGGSDDLTLSISPTSVSEAAGSNAATGTVSIPASLGTNLTVLLSSSETTAATVPTSVVIIAGDTSAPFPIAAIDDSDSDGTQIATISASAVNYTDTSFELTVTDDEPSLEGVTPSAGNNPSNLGFVADLKSGAFNLPALFRLGTGVTLPDGLTLDSSSGIIDGTISQGAATGNYPITIERYNSFAEIVSQSFTLEITGGSDFAAWIGGQSVSEFGEGDDPDRDGLANLIEYYLDGDAAVANPSIAPELGIAGSTMTLTFWHLKSASDVIATVEWSDTLLPNSWSDTGVTTEVINDEPSREQIQATIPTGSATKRFARLRVETAP